MASDACKSRTLYAAIMKRERRTRTGHRASPAIGREIQIVPKWHKMGYAVSIAEGENGALLHSLFAPEGALLATQFARRQEKAMSTLPKAKRTLPGLLVLVAVLALPAGVGAANKVVTANDPLTAETKAFIPLDDHFLVFTGGLRKRAQAAARFLRQTTFGYTRDDIVALMNQSPQAWIEAQFALPATSHLATVQADPERINRPWDVVMPSIWKQYFEGQDQFRQRVAYALSQIFVISLVNNAINDAPCGAAAYLDILNTQAFGNVRTLLRDVTLNAAMGEYLSMRESAKGDPVLQTQPDENYAREIMQLFSIGLWMLNLDGTRKLDGNGNPIPTYAEETVREFARVLSGWTFSNQDQQNPNRWLNPDLWDSDPTIRAAKSCAAWGAPMAPWIEVYKSVDNTRYISGPAHDTGPKTLLTYPNAPHTQIPAHVWGQSLDEYVRGSLEKAIDNIFYHPNVGPFLSRQLIQRLVTSNPSPEYIARVSQKFNDNGQGVRGDMRAILRAILLDQEARNSSIAQRRGYGKLTEPVIRFVQMHRAFRAIRPNGYRGLYDFSSPTNLNQNPLRSPSVFNFYHPDFVPTGPLSQNGLFGPEFEITDASSIAGYANFSKYAMIDGFDHSSSTPGNRMIPDYSFYLGLTNDPALLIEELDLLLCAGGMTREYKSQLAESIGKIPPTSGSDRLHVALWMIINSPDYLVQK